MKREFGSMRDITMVSNRHFCSGSNGGYGFGERSKPDGGSSAGRDGSAGY